MYFYSLSRPLALSTPLDDIYIRLPLVICGTTNAFELLFCAWYSFIAFGFNISSNDNLLPYEVAKVVLIDQKDRVLFLKRSEYVKKFSGDWDLPGGHLKENESLIAGLKREVLEETGLDVREPVLFHNLDNLNFFYSMYDSGEVQLSHEHTDYKFFEKKDLDPGEKFQKIALKALEKNNESIDY